MIGVRPGETASQATERIEGVLDRSFPDWRSRLTWRRTGVVDGGAGPADPPGTSWRDRPAIDRGSGVWLAGDKVAAPGILSEASFESARLAAEAAVAKVSG